MNAPAPQSHPAIDAAASAAGRAFRAATATYDRAELARTVGQGADGTPTMRIDELVETAILEAVAPFGINVLSEEAGFVDVGSARTLVVDPLDGSANGAAGVPLCCFSAALVEEDAFTEALTVWLATGQRWASRADLASPWQTSGRQCLDGAAISLLRPHPANASASAAWWSIAEQAARVRILSCSTLEAMLVAQGSTDGFADAGTDTHRLVDLAAALVVVPRSGGAVLDAFGRPIEFDIDQTRRWSGIVAASPALAEQLAGTIVGTSMKRT